VKTEAPARRADDLGNMRQLGVNRNLRTILTFFIAPDLLNYPPTRRDKPKSEIGFLGN
jgi:hypothetical protein